MKSKKEKIKKSKKEFIPLSGRKLPRFSGIKTFFRLPSSDLQSNYDLGLLGVPFDGGTTYRPGARFAPTRIREISSLGRTYHWERNLSFLENLKVADLGDAPTYPMDLQKTHKNLTNFVSTLFNQKKKMIFIGGDHSLTLPLLRAAKKKHGLLSLIHFDAHLDTYPKAWGFDYHHGTFLRHAIKEKLVEPQTSLHIGLRGPLSSKEDLQFVKKHKLNLITVENLKEAQNLKAFLSKSLFHFEKRPTYITFDIDCIDPSMAPGTGTPVPGGLSTYEVQQILRALKIKNLVAADLVEVSPPFDSSEITSLAASDVIFELMCLFSLSEKTKNRSSKKKGNRVR